MKVIPETFCVQ